METAIRLHHEPTGVTSQAEESRSLEENRRRALRRLRQRIALDMREAFDPEAPRLPSEFLGQRGPEGSLSVNAKNPAYPIVVATALDALTAAEGGYATAARALGLTTSQLLRFLRSDPQVWRAVKQIRLRRV